MPKKKQVRNGFYWFMQDLMPDLRREGRVFPNGMADVVPVAMPRWKALSAEDKERYENKARQEKKKMKSSEGDKYKMDNSGNVIAERKDPKVEAMKRRQAESRRAKSRWPPGLGVKDHKFYFMSIEILCRTERGDFLPCEIALVEFSLSQGITKTFHKFPNPGPIPLGYRFTCQSHSDETHLIDIEDFEEADSNFRGIQIQIENFLNPSGEKKEYPPIHVLCNELECAEYTLELIHAQACIGRSSRISQVFELENMVCDLFDVVGKHIDRALVLEHLSRPMWDYAPGTRCDWHEEKETRHCALFTVRRFCYAMADILADPYDIKLTKAHKPPETEGKSFHVAKMPGFAVEPPPPRREPVPARTQTKSVWDREDGGANCWANQGNAQSGFASRDIRYQDAESSGEEDFGENSNFPEFTESLRKPRMPGDDFGAASTAWGMSNIQAYGNAPAAAAGDDAEEWPSLGGQPKFAGRASAPPASRAPAPPTTWAARTQSAAPAVSQENAPYVEHKVEPVQPKKMSIHEAARQKEMEDQQRLMASQAAASQQQASAGRGSPCRPAGGLQPSNPRGPSNPRDRAALAAPRKINVGRGFKPTVNTAPESLPVPAKGGFGFAPQPAGKPQATSRPPAAWPSMQQQAAPDARTQQNGVDPSMGPAARAWGRGAPPPATASTMNAGIGRGRGVPKSQPVSLPPGLVKPPPGLGRGVLAQFSELSVGSSINSEDFS